jgi:hypothetical protein
VILVVFLLGWGLGIERGVDGKFVVDSPDSFGEAVQNILNGAQSSWSNFITFFEPVTDTYGPTSALILIAVLLLSVGYWVFARG